MIEFLEIRDKTRKLIGIIDTASSIIWQTEYYGTGKFEIVCAFSEEARDMLQIGHYVTRRDEKQAAIIEALEFINDTVSGAQIIASGRMLKSILDRRIAYIWNGDTYTMTPVRMYGNLATAVQNVVRTQAGADAPPARIMPIVIGSNGGITTRITADSEQSEDSSRQSTYRNLLKFTDTVLQEFKCGALMRIDDSTLEIIYDLYEGKDRSAGNTAGNIPLTFSQDFENLLNTDFEVNTEYYKNFAVVGGEGEGLDRFYTLFRPDSTTGLDRRETFVDASSINRKYMDGDEEKTYTPLEYSIMLKGQAQTELRELITTEVFNGEINVTNNEYQYRKDFDLGDLVTVQDNRLGIYKTVRILRATEVQDNDGYILTFEYGIEEE